MPKTHFIIVRFCRESPKAKKMDLTPKDPGTEDSLPQMRMMRIMMKWKKKMKKVMMEKVMMEKEERVSFLRLSEKEGVENVVIEDAKPEEKRKGEKENPLKSEEKGVEKQEGNKVN